MVISPVNIEERKKLDIRPGDIVRVHQTIQETSEKKRADKKMEKKMTTRTQIFEGLVLAKKHGKEAGGTFTVRKVASGVGVEKIFPIYSPVITKIEIVSRGKARRAKLYFIRDKATKAASKKMRQERFATALTADETMPDVAEVESAVATAEVAS
ncbi:MAG TPA: 50S ribosomal protein L19 [Candidatus Paceibacterota bacterium]